MKPQPIELLEQVKEIARLAGDAIMTIYEHGDFELYQKNDESPVTTADYAANEVLIKALTELTPDIPVISEETKLLKLAQREHWSRYWLLDPMDGTQEFVSRSGDFAVNIALVENGWPVLGVIYWPTQNTWYYATKGNGAFKQKDEHVTSIQVAKHQPNDQLTIAVSRVQKSDTVGRYLTHPNSHAKVQQGSCSLKSCLIAEGVADFYLRIGPTGEWDTGASHCILHEAGGEILDAEFNPLTYNQRETLANPDFLVLGDQSINWQDVIIPHKTLRTL
ncbi:3'(2'),5'-bisphosphate nucleotidase CysQ [Catenovulum sp. 2E275]|uniref:3'(2'),5'-bisphosphate nucleotidase CysQ n=1 Tax=Catenovulum sp. 2E275 TaxID=2980497 RepID=UPI0021D220EA|nr:3'(2'),5'-bisphosphate nucleotidase CysQ [Catenovulum sp. 2E275]MCU4674361.1 3'(2'),5'-bisphosphate nucleotidase CysQ [Catenovulum sp. 2E275]